uniref:Uncharacterized protein n=1 Tax=Anopheles epiroticus TaxID=199890 RepID=A0A182PWG3_9DIPT
MHFWIDKRSQACGFGRARVAASLSGGGGLGFGHPRRVPRKSMVTPIHRFQTVDCNRPHFHRQQQSQQQQLHQSQTNPSIPGTHHSSTQSQHSSAHHHQQQQQQQQQQLQHPHQSHANQQHHHHHPHHPHHNQTITQQQQQQQHQSQSSNLQQQQVHQVQLHISGQYNSQSSILPAPSPYPQSSPNLQQSSSPNALNYHIEGISNAGQQVQPHVGHDAQLLPAHLKCGMWASLALATVFVAGAKFYFDHQGTGLEVLIFCAFSATFFLAACTVSLWRRPRDIQITGNNVISETISNAEQSSLQNNPEFLSSNPSPLLNGSAGSGPLGGLVPGNIQQAALASIVAPPPPYHIAILLPDNTKDVEETPPPSYDKIVI